LSVALAMNVTEAARRLQVGGPAGQE
jgi:hypothetical protein